MIISIQHENNEEVGEGLQLEVWKLKEQVKRLEAES